MKPGDLFCVKSTCDPRWIPQAYTLDPGEKFEYAFTLTYNEVGIIIDPVGWGGYKKVMLRGQVVWMVFMPHLLRIVS